VDSLPSAQIQTGKNMPIQRLNTLNIKPEANRKKTSYFSSDAACSSSSTQKRLQRLENPIFIGQGNHFEQTRAKSHFYGNIGNTKPMRNPLPFIQNSRPKNYWSSTGTHHSIRIVGSEVPGGCGVSCIAMVAGIPVEEAKNAAMTHGEFSVNWGMPMEGVAKTLNALGIQAKWHETNPGLNGLPDLAVLCVYATSGKHAVVFKRKTNGKAYIYDVNQTGPLDPSPYSSRLDESLSYVEVFKSH
jgi:hypothetical protein